MIPAGAKEAVVIFDKIDLETPRLIPRKYHAIKLAIIKAEKGCPNI